MAKQYGIHQLRGKVGNMSYYRQSGVQSGLVRNINSGMSNRVKTSVEYANTRLNNQEFKTAAKLGASMLQAVIPSYRPMFQTFKFAQLAKFLLAIIKSSTGAWGLRKITYANSIEAADAISSLAKNRFENLATFSADNDEDTNVHMIVTFANGIEDQLAALGADGMVVRFSYVYVYEGTPTADPSATPENVVVISSPQDIPVASPESLGDCDVDINDEGPDLNLLSGRLALRFCYCVLMPYRTVNNVKHIMQEGCTFKVLRSPISE